MNKEQLNFCEDCLCDDHNYSDLVFETGSCCYCGKPCCEVVDVELINFYFSMGFDTEFIHPHLPRLRKYISYTITMEDIGREISRHIVSGECGGKGSCQGYTVESRLNWKFKA
jgi:hypothetical protein